MALVDLTKKLPLKVTIPGSKWDLLIIAVSLLLVGVSLVVAVRSAVQYTDARADRLREAIAEAEAKAASAASALDAPGLSLNNLDSNVAWLSLKQSGYGFILSEDGVFLAHPISEFVEEPKTVLDSADPELLNMVAVSGAKGLRGRVDYGDEVTGESAWIVYVPILSKNWTLGSVVLKKEVLFRTEQMRRMLMRLVVATIATFFLGFGVLFPAYRGSLMGLWGVALLFATLSVVGIASVWYLVLTTPPADDPTIKSLAMSIDEHKIHLQDKHGLESIDVWTGIFLTTLEFVDAGRINATGIIWQRYPGGVEEGLEPGFKFPDAEVVTFERVYERWQDGSQVIGWSFRAVLLPKIDYSTYPFDREDISIRMWHNAFDREVFLLPDMAHYDTLIPSAKPGIGTSFDVEGWHTDTTFFNYGLFEYNTDFGVDHVGVTHSAELIYNLGLRRAVLDPVISNLLPLSIVLVLLFAVLMVVTKDESRARLSGFSPTAVLAYCGALLFAIILAQSRLRSELPVQGLIYLEYYYLVGYLAILAVSVNAILFAANLGGPLIHARDNLIPRVIYWPAITGIMLLITWVVFY